MQEPSAPSELCNWYWITSAVLILVGAYGYNVCLHGNFSLQRTPCFTRMFPEHWLGKVRQSRGWTFPASNVNDSRNGRPAIIQARLKLKTTIFRVRAELLFPRMLQGRNFGSFGRCQRRGTSHQNCRPSQPIASQFLLLRFRLPDEIRGLPTSKIHNRSITIIDMVATNYSIRSNGACVQLPKINKNEIRADPTHSLSPYAKFINSSPRNGNWA